MIIHIIIIIDFLNSYDSYTVKALNLDFLHGSVEFLFICMNVNIFTYSGPKVKIIQILVCCISVFD